LLREYKDKKTKNNKTQNKEENSTTKQQTQHPGKGSDKKQTNNINC